MLSWPPNTISDAYYPELAGILFELAVRVKKATGAPSAYMNLSGGVGIPYRPEQTERNYILAIGEGVRQKFERLPGRLPGWAMWPSSVRWAVLPPVLVRCAGGDLPSTRSISIRSISAWMPALPT